MARTIIIDEIKRNADRAIHPLAENLIQTGAQNRERKQKRQNRRDNRHKREHANELHMRARARELVASLRPHAPKPRADQRHEAASDENIGDDQRGE